MLIHLLIFDLTIYDLLFSYCQYSIMPTENQGGAGKWAKNTRRRNNSYKEHRRDLDWHKRYDGQRFWNNRRIIPLQRYGFLGKPARTLPIILRKNRKNSKITSSTLLQRTNFQRFAA